MAVSETARIRVIIEAVHKGVKQSFGVVRKQSVMLKQNMQGLNTVLHQNMEQFKRNIVPMQGMTNWGARLGHRIRMMTHGMRGFRMEMLGVMFFGMGMKKLFMDMLQPAADLYGIMDLWRIMLGVLFLPVIAELFPYFMDMFDVIVNLSPELKILTGIFAIAGAVIGTFIMLVGMLALGLGSIIQVGIIPLIWAFASLVAIVIGVGLIVHGLYLVFKGRFEGIGLIIMGVGFILLLFIGWWALIPMAVGAGVYLIIKHWKKLKVGMIVLVRDLLKLLLKVPLLGTALKLIGVEEAIENLDSIGKAVRAEIRAENEVAEREGGKGIIATVNSWKEGFKNLGNETKDGMADVNNLMDTGMITNVKIVEEAMKSMGGNWQDGLNIQLEATKTYVKDTNNALSDIIGGVDRFEIYPRAVEVAPGVWGAPGTVYTPPKTIGEGVMKEVDDFIWRPGSAPVKVNPADTLVGTKGGMAGGVTIHQTNNINSTIKDDINRMIEDNNRKIVDDLKRFTSVGG